MKKPDITPREWKPRKHVFGSKARDKEMGFVVEGADPKVRICEIRCSPETPFTVARANAQAIAALPKLLDALEQAHNALLYIAQEAEARAGVPKPIIGGARHHAAQAHEAMIAAGYTE